MTCNYNIFLAAYKGVNLILAARNSQIIQYNSLNSYIPSTENNCLNLQKFNLQINFNITLDHMAKIQKKVTEGSAWKLSTIGYNNLIPSIKTSS